MKKIKSDNKRAGTACVAIGLLMVTAALFLTLYNRWDAGRADRAAREVLEKLEDKLPDGKRIRETVDDPYGDMPTVEIDGNFYIGIIEIPSLDLRLPVMEACDEGKLKTAPCRYYGSYYTDDMVVAGHNYARHFSPLKWIDIGSDIYFTNVEGESRHYIVDNVETLQPEQVENMITGDWDLTLFTCTTGGKSRCTVRCMKVESQ